MSEEVDAINDEERKQTDMYTNERAGGWKDDGWMDEWMGRRRIDGQMDR